MRGDTIRLKSLIEFFSLYEITLAPTDATERPEVEGLFIMKSTMLTGDDDVGAVDFPAAADLVLTGDLTGDDVEPDEG